MPGFLTKVSPSRNPRGNILGDNTSAMRGPDLSTHVVLCKTARYRPVTKTFVKEIKDHINCVGGKAKKGEGKGRPRTGHEGPERE